MSDEAAFRDWLRGRWVGWLDGREPRGPSRSGWGSGSGAPDLTLGVPLPVSLYRNPPDQDTPAVQTRVLVFPLQVELKLAELRGDKLVAVNGVRENQARWHRKARAARLITAFIWGVRSGQTPEGWRAFLMLPNDGWAMVSEVIELRQEERLLPGAVGEWVTRRWLQNGP